MLDAGRMSRAGISPTMPTHTPTDTNRDDASVQSWPRCGISEKVPLVRSRYEVPIMRGRSRACARSSSLQFVEHMDAVQLSQRQY